MNFDELAIDELVVCIDYNPFTRRTPSDLVLLLVAKELDHLVHVRRNGLVCCYISTYIIKFEHDALEVYLTTLSLSLLN